MQTVSLSWQHSFELAAGLTVVGAALAVPANPRARFVGAFLRETAVIGALYGLWQLAGKLSGLSTGAAYQRGRFLARAEHDLRLPSEHAMQQLILGHPLLVHAADLYYATMHFTMMFVFLIWLFVRHRDRYRPIRSVLALTTLACLLVQLVPVAPPRMFPGLGVVDTAIRNGESVYSNGFAIDQLSAMPSVHVAWAVLVGYYSWRVSTSRWRYLGWTHTAITVFVVLVTGNHWWLDGIVASVLLVLAAWTVHGVGTAWRAVRPAAAGRPLAAAAAAVPRRPSSLPAFAGDQQTNSGT